MGIYSAVPPPDQPGINVEAWTDEAITQFSSMHISAALGPSVVRGVPASLDIELDQVLPTEREAFNAVADAQQAAQRRAAFASRRREPLRRDSLKRREALLMGKEGSRRRQKWENDRLIGNPWFEPPSAEDWAPRPTHPVQTVPYYLAPMWDEKKARANASRAQQERRIAMSKGNGGVAEVPKEFRQKLKKSKAAKGLLQDLEERVREFISMWDEKRRELQNQGLADADSSEDEEIVFVGRNGHMRDEDTSDSSERRLKRDQLIFDSLVDDHGASFGRWLVHSIADYYELQSWSITTDGKPARREAYVSIPMNDCTSIRTSTLPRPLWGMV